MPDSKWYIPIVGFHESNLLIYQRETMKEIVKISDKNFVLIVKLLEFVSTISFKSKLLAKKTGIVDETP